MKERIARFAFLHQLVLPLHSKRLSCEGHLCSLGLALVHHGRLYGRWRQDQDKGMPYITSFYDCMLTPEQPSALRSIIAGSTAGAVEIGE